MTQQRGDVLFYAGQRYEIFDLPLMSLGKDWIPDIDASCTDCWRGLVAYWTVDAGRLALLALEAQGTAKFNGVIREPTFNDVFPDHFPPVPADWHTGTIDLPRGAVLIPAHGQGLCPPVNEETLRFHIQEGQIVREELLDNRRPC